MEVLLPAIMFVLIVLPLLILAVPGLAVVFVLALPVAAAAFLVRLIHPGARPARPAIARTAPTMLAGAGAGGVGIGVVRDRFARTAPSPEYRSSRSAGLTPRPHPTPIELQAIGREFRSDEALFAFDRDLTVVAWNKAAAELTGIPVQEALGRRCWELLGGVDARGHLVCHSGCPGARLASQGPSLKGERLLIKTATGARRAAWLTTIAVGGGDESLTLHLLRNEPEVAREERTAQARA